MGAFTKKYNVHKLVYFEYGNDVNAAIFREKQIKAGSRQKKIDLVKSMNPDWKDLYEEYFGDNGVYRDSDSDEAIPQKRGDCFVGRTLAVT